MYKGVHLQSGPNRREERKENTKKRRRKKKKKKKAAFLFPVIFKFFKTSDL